jgi:hypothetical protein
MALSMMKSANQADHSMMSMMYVFLVTAILDFTFNTAYPSCIRRVREYYATHTPTILQPTEKSKTSSITLLIKISDHENVYGQALLDYITHHQNTKHITYKKQNFILNQTEVIEITEGIFVLLKDQKDDEKGEVEQQVELYSYTKNTLQLRQFLSKLAHEYEIKLKNKLGDHVYYFNQHPMVLPPSSTGVKDYSKLPANCVFTMKKFQTNRKFSNLFGPEMDAIKKRVDFFIKNKGWYDEKGIPYTLGLLLSGQAGAGKTSSIKCLANETNRHIINVNLNNDISKTQFENLFFNEVIHVLNTSSGQTEKYSIPLDQRIYVLEDIDCQGDLVMERTKRVDISGTLIPEKMDLSFLLNILDGVLEIPGRIVIMTSNYMDQLDHALIRPGRIDVIANFKKCLNSTLIEMMEFFYDLSLTPSEKKRILGLEEYVISPAEMGKLLFEHFEEYSKVLETLELKKNNSPSSAQIIQLFHRFLNKSTREERMHELKSLEFTPSEMGQVIIDYFEEFKDTLVNVEYGKALVSMKETQTESQSLHVEYREYNEIPELSDISEFSDEDHTLNPYERYTGPGSFLK